MLDKDVDEKYYVSDAMLNYFMGVNQKPSKFDRKSRFMANMNRKDQDRANSITTNAGQRPTDNFVRIPEKTIKGYKEAYDGDGVYLDRPHQKRGCVQKDSIPTLKTSGKDIGVVIDDMYKNRDARTYTDAAPTLRSERSGLKTVGHNLRIRKLTPLSCYRLMGFADEDFYKAQSAGISDTQLYRQAGNSIVVAVLQAILKELLCPR